MNAEHSGKESVLAFWLKAFQSPPPVRVLRFCGRCLSVGMECGGSSLPHSYSDELDLLGLGDYGARAVEVQKILEPALLRPERT